jgi:peptidoglycan L-alanyl-D-glutamate endopeptidase CwlK
MSNLLLYKCHPKLIKIFEQVTTPHVVFTGYRGKEDQDRLFKEKKTDHLYPNSKHNKQPSEAVDAAPLKNGQRSNYIDWNDLKLFAILAKEVLAIAEKEKIKISWSGNWVKGMKNGNKEYCHFELVTEVE